MQGVVDLCTHIFPSLKGEVSEAKYDLDLKAILDHFKTKFGNPTSITIYSAFWKWVLSSQNTGKAAATFLTRVQECGRIFRDTLGDISTKTVLELRKWRDLRTDTGAL